MKAGRPRKHGYQPEWMGRRALLILYYFSRLRPFNEKYAIAVDAVVASMREKHPEVPISRTEVKRVLAKFRPHGAERVWVLRVPEPEAFQEPTLVRCGPPIEFEPFTVILIDPRHPVRVPA